MKLSKRTVRAVEKYGLSICMRAIALNCQGEGASTIGFYLGLPYAAANSAICAGREMREKLDWRWNGKACNPANYEENKWMHHVDPSVFGYQQAE